MKKEKILFLVTYDILLVVFFPLAISGITSDENLITNGDFSSGLTNWTEVLNPGCAEAWTRTTSLIASDSPYSNVLEVASSGAGGCCGTAERYQDLNVDVQSYNSINFLAVVKAISASVVDGCGWYGSEYPIEIIINYISTDTSQKKIIFAFYYRDGTCGHPTNYPSNTIYVTIPVTQNVWYEFASTNLKSLASDISRITRVEIMGNGWDYRGRVDNVKLVVEPLLSPTSFGGVATSTYSITWSWIDNSSNETGYRVHDAGGNLLATLPANTTYWAETGINANTAYTRYVEVYNNLSTKVSASSTVYTLANIPTGLSAGQETSNTITLSWTGDGTRYKIERAPDNSGSSGIWTAIKTWSDNITSTSYVDSSLQPNTTYWYRIVAYNAVSAESAPSNEVAWQTGPGLPTTPVDDGVWATTTTLTFKWTQGQAVGADKYHIQIGETPGGNSVLDTEVSVNVTSVTITTAQDGYRYYARVRAKNSGGKYGTWTPSSDGIGVDITPPGPTTITSLTHPCQTTYYAIISPSFNLSNDDFSGAGHYYLIDQNPTTVPTTSDNFTLLSTVTLSALADGTYYFHALAKDAAGNLGTSASHFKFNIKTQINPSISDVFYLSNGSEIDVPANAISAATNFIISISTFLPSSTIRNPYVEPIKKTYDIKLASGQSILLKPITLTLKYTDDEIAGKNENQLKIAYWDESKLIWVLLFDSVVYPSENKITATINHLTLFSIVELITGSGSIIDEAYNYPNPFNTTTGTTIRYILKNSASSADIKIFDITGRLIRKLSGTGNIGINDIFWNGRDDSGNFVNSDVFICVVEVSDLSGKKIEKTIKLAAWRFK